MEDGIVAVLPGLVDETFVRQPSVFNKTVSISVAVLVYPCQCGLDMRQEPPDGGEIFRSGRGIPRRA